MPSVLLTVKAGAELALDGSDFDSMLVFSLSLAEDAESTKIRVVGTAGEQWCSSVWSAGVFK